jgi:hypothetical protein
MSYFPELCATDCQSEPACIVEDLEQKVAVQDGVVVERRSVLWLSAAAVTAMLVGTRHARGQDPVRKQESGQQGQGPTPNSTVNRKLSFAEFLEQLYPQAQRLIESRGEDEEAYLLTVAAALSRLQDAKAPIRDAMREFSRTHQKEGERFPIGVMAMELQAGKGFSHHDHLNYNGVIMGLEGEVRIRNYDFQGEPPATDSSETFQIRETRNDLILPGRFSSLGQKRENVHDLVAGKAGARVLDIFTFFAKNAGSRYLEVETTPRDADARIFDAAWQQRRRK